MTTPIIVDVEGAMVAWIKGVAGLTGAGNPLPNGIHFGARSPSRGCWANVQVLAPRNPDDVSDLARVSFSVKAVGSGADQGPRWAAQRAANALARVVGNVHAPVVVTTKMGDVITIWGTGELAGPTWAGDGDGEATYLVDITVRLT